jgi:IS30 family transposase
MAARQQREHQRAATQYLPKRTDLKAHSQIELDAIALELNGRPRQTLKFMTPSQKYAEAVALTP